MSVISQKRLFSGQTIDSYIAGDRASRVRKVNEVSDLEDLEALAVTSPKMAHCTLLRDAAEFRVDETDTGVAVDLVVPLEGGIRLLTLSPEIGVGVGPVATLDDGGWASADKRPRVTISHAFPTGTSPETVKTWAKDTADQIEAMLAKIHAKIDEYNAVVKDELEQLVQERRRVLQTGASLREGLQGGI